MGISLKLEIETKPQISYVELLFSKVKQPIESFFNWLIQKTDSKKLARLDSQKGY